MRRLAQVRSGAWHSSEGCRRLLRLGNDTFSICNHLSIRTRLRELELGVMNEVGAHFFRVAARSFQQDIARGDPCLHRLRAGGSLRMDGTGMLSLGSGSGVEAPFDLRCYKWPSWSLPSRHMRGSFFSAIPSGQKALGGVDKFDRDKRAFSDLPRGRISIPRSLRKFGCLAKRDLSPGAR